MDGAVVMRGWMLWVAVVTLCISNLESLWAAPGAGHIDAASCDLIAGWACDTTGAPGAAVAVDFWENGAGIGQHFSGTATVAGRTDADSSCGSNTGGVHAFGWAVPASLEDNASHTIAVYEVDGQGATLIGNKTIGPCSPPGTPPVPPPPVAPGHIQYFGYWGTDAPEMADHTNLKWVNADWNTAQGLATTMAQIEQGRTQGRRVILGMPTPSNDPAWLLNLLKPDVGPPDPVWQNLIAALNSGSPSHISNVAAIFLIDEPQGTGDWATTKKDVEIIAGVIKQAFPGTPIFDNFLPPGDPYYASHGVAPIGPLPTNVDWVSFDCYGSWNNCDGYGQPYMTALTQFENPAVMSPSQKIFLIPMGFQDFHHPEYGWNMSQADQVTLAGQYFNLAQSDPSIIGLFPFGWGYGNPSDSQQVSLVNMPDLRATFVTIGKAILASQTPPVTDTDVDIGLRAQDSTGIVKIAVEPAGTLTSPLRIQKGGAPYGVSLVAPSDPNASKIIIQTPAGEQKALKKLP